MRKTVAKAIYLATHVTHSTRVEQVRSDAIGFARYYAGVAGVTGISSSFDWSPAGALLSIRNVDRYPDLLAMFPMADDGYGALVFNAADGSGFTTRPSAPFNRGFGFQNQMLGNAALDIRSRLKTNVGMPHKRTLFWMPYPHEIFHCTV